MRQTLTLAGRRWSDITVVRDVSKPGERLGSKLLWLGFILVVISENHGVTFVSQLAYTRWRSASVPEPRGVMAACPGDDLLR